MKSPSEKQQPFFQFLENQIKEQDIERRRIYEIINRLGPLVSPQTLEDYLFSGLSLLRCTNKFFFERRSSEMIEWLLGKLSAVNTFSTHLQRFCIDPFLHQVTFPFQVKEVLGLLITIQGPLLSLETIEETVLSELTSSYLVDGSPFVLPYLNSSLSFFYLELQNNRNTFGPLDARSLNLNLSKKLDQEIEKAALPQLFPNNRELLMKNFQPIMKELQLKDLPHIFIDFAKQTGETYQFFLIICRYKALHEPSLKTLISTSDIQIDESTDLIEKDGVKEGVACTVDIPITSNITPYDARQKCGALISSLIGPYRDVNGGLLEKIDKNFEQFASLLSVPKARLASFFHGISPYECQATTPPKIIALMYRAVEKEIAHCKKVSFSSDTGSDYALVTIQFTHSQFKKSFSRHLLTHFPRIIISSKEDKERTIICCALYSAYKEDYEKLISVSFAFYREWMEKKEVKQTLSIGCSTPFSSFDPRIGTDEETSYLHSMLFEGLMKKGLDGQPELGIAKKVDISEDRCHYRFHLRKSYWSNGYALTAKDFEYSWKSSLKPDFLSRLSYLFYSIKNGKKVKEGQLPLSALGLNVHDDYTLDVELEYPIPYFLDLCTHSAFFPICALVDLNNPSWSEGGSSEYVCNGPFVIKEKKNPNDLKLEKNPRYWEKERLSIESLTISVMDGEQCSFFFQKKQLDVVSYPLCENRYLCADDDPPIQKWQELVHRRYLCINCTNPIFNNKKMRQALSLALNRKALSSQFLHKSFPLYSLYSPHFSQLKIEDKKEENPKLGMWLIEEGLKELGAGRDILQHLKITTTTNHESLAQNIIDQINQCYHFEWTCELISNKKIISLLKEHPPLFLIYGWTDRVSDPSYFLEIFSSEVNILNHSFWSDPKIQSLIKKIRKVRDKSKYLQLHQEAEAFLLEQKPMIPLNYNISRSLRQE